MGSTRKKQHLIEKGFKFSTHRDILSGTWKATCKSELSTEFYGEGQTEADAISTACHKANAHIKNNMQSKDSPCLFVKPLSEISNFLLTNEKFQESSGLLSEMKLLMGHLILNELLNAKHLVYENLEQIKQFPDLYAIIQKYNLSLSKTQISKLGTDIKVL